MKQFTKMIALLVAVMMILPLAACGTDLSSTKEERRTVMTIDGYEVPYEMYRYAALMHLRDRANIILADAEITVDSTADSGISVSAAVDSLTDEEKAELRETVESDAMDTLKEIYGLFTAAKDEGIDPFGERVNTLTDMKMEELRATYENDGEYKSTLELYHMNDSVYGIITRYEILFDLLYDEYVKDGKIDVSDEAAIEYLKGDNAARAKQILISFERHSEEEAKALATEVYDTVMKECVGEDGTVDHGRFDELTDEYGEDLFMFKNRDGYYISRGYNDEEFEKAVFALEVDGISPPVRLTAGYSIILRAAKDLTYIEDKVGTLKEASLTGIYRIMLEEYTDGANVSTNAEFDKLDIFTMN